LTDISAREHAKTRTPAREISTAVRVKSKAPAPAGHLGRSQRRRLARKPAPVGRSHVFEFRVGVEVGYLLVRAAQVLAERGELTEREISALHQTARAEGQVGDWESLFIAALREPDNAARLKGSRLDHGSPFRLTFAPGGPLPATRPRRRVIVVPARPPQVDDESPPRREPDPGESAQEGDRVEPVGDGASVLARLPIASSPTGRGHGRRVLARQGELATKTNSYPGRELILDAAGSVKRMVPFRHLPTVDEARAGIRENLSLGQPPLRMLAALLDVCQVVTVPDARAEGFVHPVDGVIAVMRRGLFPEIEAMGPHPVALYQPGLYGVDFVFTGRQPQEPGGTTQPGGGTTQPGGGATQPGDKDPSDQSGASKATPGTSATDTKDPNKNQPTQPPVSTWIDPLEGSYRRHFPNEKTGTAGDFTTDHKVRLALELADYTFLGEVGQAAKNAITDPTFIIVTVLTIGIYVGLWLAPDVTITKVAAGILTAAMLLLFTWNDLWGFCVAWDDIYAACRKATTEDDLRIAGDKCLAKMGQVGFDVLLMLLFWGVEKGVGPKIRAGVKARATARANARVAAIEVEPGTGVDVKAAGDRAQVVPRVAQKVGANATPSEFLDALATELDSVQARKARQGLDAFRDTQRAGATKRAGKTPTADPKALGDAAAKAAIDGRQRSGSDIVRWLEEQAMTKEERGAAQDRLGEAKADAALKRILELRDDPALARPAKQAGWIRNIIALVDVLIGRSAKLREAISTKNKGDLVGLLGEILSRAELRGRIRGLAGFEIKPSLEVARRVPDVKTVGEWLAAKVAAWEAGGRVGDRPTSRDAARLRVRGDEVWESLGQADNVVVENQSGGKARVDTIEETKTGSEQPTDARTQVNRFKTELGAIGDGTSTARVFEKTGAQELGRDCTDDLDLASVKNAKTSITGLEGRTGYDTKLPVDRGALEGAADQLIQRGVPREDVAIPPPPQRTPDRNE
jgi:hypothetical protein